MDIMTLVDITSYDLNLKLQGKNNSACVWITAVQSFPRRWISKETVQPFQPLRGRDDELIQTL